MLEVFSTIAQKRRSYSIIPYVFIKIAGKQSKKCRDGWESL